MIFDKEGNTTIVFQERVALVEFVENFKQAYDSIKGDHIILNLFSFNDLTKNDVLEFLQLSNSHQARQKSFVLVTDKVSYDEVPEKINVVPTLQEAKDLIEMEDIERDLGL